MARDGMANTRQAEDANRVFAHLGKSRYYRTADLDFAYVRGLANQFEHVATRLDTAYREAERAAAMGSRQPDALRRLFNMGMNHLRTARESIGYYGEALREITAHLGGDPS